MCHAHLANWCRSMRLRRGIEIDEIVVGGDDGDAAADDSLFVNASSLSSLSIQRRQPMKLKQQRQST